MASDARTDLVLGPGKDGIVLEPEGLSTADMTPDQQALLLALIEARLGMLNDEDLAPAMVAIEVDPARHVSPSSAPPATPPRPTGAWWARP